MLLDACKLLGAAIVIGVGVTIGKRAGKKLCNLVDGQVGDETSFMRKRLAEFRRIFDKDPTAADIAAMAADIAAIKQQVKMQAAAA